MHPENESEGNEIIATSTIKNTPNCNQPKLPNQILHQNNVLNQNQIDVKDKIPRIDGVIDYIDANLLQLNQ